MKYRLYVDRKAWITDKYEVDIPDSILAEMMDESGYIDPNLVFEYIYYDNDPVWSDTTDEEIRNWDIVKVDEQEENK